LHGYLTPTTTPNVTLILLETTTIGPVYPGEVANAASYQHKQGKGDND
jgi:hypothetical protein